MSNFDGNGDDDLLVAAVLRMVGRSPAGWTGTATELLAGLKAAVPAARRGPAFPCDASRAGHMLSRLEAALAAAGVACLRAEEGHANRRVIRLAPAAAIAGEPDDDDEAADDDGVAWCADGGGGAGFSVPLAVIAVGLLLIWLLSGLPGLPAAVDRPTA